MKLAAVSWLTLLAGCNVAFGISTFELPIDAPAIDATPIDDSIPDIVLTGTLAQTFIYNNTSLIPTRTRTTLSAAAVAITVDDPITAVQTPVPYNENTGTFSLTFRPGTRPRIQIHTGGTTINEFQWDLPNLAVNFLAYTRIGTVAAPANTSLAGTYLPAGGLYGPAIYATGIFQSAQFLTNATTSTYTATWTGPLESANAHDQFIFVDYDVDGKGNTIVDRKAAIPSVNMTGGAVNTVNISFATIPLDSCVLATTNAAQNLARMTALATSFSAAPATSPYLVAYSSPAPDLGPGISWQLGYGGLGADPSTFSFASTVFPGFTTVIASQVSRQRTINGTALGNVMARYDKLTDKTCGTQMSFPPLSASFPNQFIVDSNMIPDGDAGAVHFDAPTAEVSWTSNGPADLYIEQVFDITAKAYNSHAIYTTVPHATFDTGEFIVGHQYMIVVSATTGLPNLAAGDYITHSYPYERGIGTSPVFLVQ